MRSTKTKTILIFQKQRRLNEDNFTIELRLIIKLALLRYPLSLQIATVNSICLYLTSYQACSSSNNLKLPFHQLISKGQVSIQ